MILPPSPAPTEEDESGNESGKDDGKGDEDTCYLAGAGEEAAPIGLIGFGSGDYCLRGLRRLTGGDGHCLDLPSDGLDGHIRGRCP